MCLLAATRPGMDRRCRPQTRRREVRRADRGAPRPADPAAGPAPPSWRTTACTPSLAPPSSQLRHRPAGYRLRGRFGRGKRPPRPKHRTSVRAGRHPVSHHLSHAGTQRVMFGFGGHAAGTPRSASPTHFGRIAAKRAAGARGWSYRLRMSPPRDIDPESPTSRDVWLSLTFERGLAADLVARLTVDEPGGRLVEVELDRRTRAPARRRDNHCGYHGRRRARRNAPGHPGCRRARGPSRRRRGTRDRGSRIGPIARTQHLSRRPTRGDRAHHAQHRRGARRSGRGLHPRAVAGRGRGPAGHRQPARDLLTPQGPFGEVQQRIATKWVRRRRLVEPRRLEPVPGTLALTDVPEAPRSLFFDFDSEGRRNAQGDDEPKSLGVLLDLTVP